MKTYVDEQTLRSLKNRDVAYLKSLFAEVNPYLTRVCAANGIFGDDIQELIQQTWSRFFENLDKFEGRSQVRTFICGILLNKIREHRRLQKRFVSEEDAGSAFAEAFTSDGDWRVAPESPHKIAEHKQASEFVQECLEGLSEQQRAAFVMKEVEEEVPTEICNVLGVSVSHLRVLLFRAKDKLRRCLQGKVGAEQI